MSSELTAEVVRQLNNLPGFPRTSDFQLGDWFTDCQVCPAVASVAALPLTDNTSGDIRFVNDVGQFYFWDGTLWATASGKQLAVKTADESVASSTVVQNDDQLYGTVVTGKKYRIRATLFFNVPADGIRLTLNGPVVTATSLKVQSLIYDTVLRDCSRMTSLGQEITHASQGPGSHYVVLDGSITANAGGVLFLQWAQQSSNVSALVLQKDSFFELERVT
jgi:hypothetical protein